MSMEMKLLQTLAKQFKAGELIVAVEKQVQNSDDRRAQFKALFEAYLEAHWDKEMKPVADFVSFYYGYGAYEKDGSKDAVAADLIGAVCDSLRGKTFGSSALVSGEWIEAIKDVAARDAVDTLKSLDEAGLIDRSDLSPTGPLRELWAAAVLNTSERCGQYLLRSTDFANLGGFPIPERDVWPESMRMARDIAASVPEADLDAYLKTLYAKGAWSTGEELYSKAVFMICAALERCDAIEGMRSSHAYIDLLSALVNHTALRSHPELRDAEVADVLLRIMENHGRLQTREAFTYALYLTEGEDGTRLSPARLNTLLQQGLPLQCEQWSRSGDDEMEHLLTEAGECYIEVIDAYVPDKVEFMRDFGDKFAYAHTKRSLNNNSTDIEKTVQGPESAALMKLVELGYPFGPLQLNKGRCTGEYALYQRVLDGTAIDAFIVGHLAGQLGPEHNFKGVGPMHLAVGVGSIPSVRALARAGFSIDEVCGRARDDYNMTRCREREGFTPVLMAIKAGNIDMLRALVDLGADVGAKAPTGATAMQLAKNDTMKTLLRSARTGNALAKAVDDLPAGAAAPIEKPKQQGFVL
jgi:hypothetical protein